MGKLISSGNGRTKHQRKKKDKKDAAIHEHSLIKYCFVPLHCISGFAVKLQLEVIDILTKNYPLQNTVPGRDFFE